MSNVKPFPTPRDRVVKLVRELALDSRVFWPDHLKEETWRSRVTYLQVQKCMAAGDVVGEPELDEYGNWACRMEAVMAGCLIHVLLAVVEDGHAKFIAVRDVIVR